MADYFTRDHFEQLSKWAKHKRDESNSEQNQVYEDLKKAYAVTQAWADKLKAELFPVGRVEIRKRPTNQGNHFSGYTWAKIYPSPEAPKELAFTVGTDADDGFVVKIDTVGLDESSNPRQAYLALRGDYHNAPFVTTLPASEGVELTLDQLTAWSAEAIRNFKVRYEEVVAKMGLGKSLGDEDLLQHFDSKPAFQNFRASWSPEEKARFCRLARAVHMAGLDWWHSSKGIQLRFGRKNPGSERAVGVLGIVRGMRVRKLSWKREVTALPILDRAPLTDELLGKIEASLVDKHDLPEDWLLHEAERPGLWPDQLRDDPVENSDEPDEEDSDEPDAVRLPLNRIYYGPPGTGKTYELSKLLKREYEQATASVSKEAWQNQFVSGRIARLTWWEAAAATLYQLGGRARVDALLEHPFMKSMAAAKSTNKNIRNTVWSVLQYHAVEPSETIKMSKRMAPAVFDKLADSSWILTGDWADAAADLRQLVDEYNAGPPSADYIKRYSFVTFHQSYGYEEFVEGLRPVLEGDAEAGEIQYEIRAGVFKDLCRKARMAPDQQFAMVIDEINRGNISKIFGELITLIEPDKREGAENAVSVTLPYSGESFSIPANVDLIATMNTADRSLALLDTALRRRFEFVPLMPNAGDEPGAPLASLRVSLGEQVVDVPRMLAAINQRIEVLYDRDHCIGHAYFTALAQVPDGELRFVALQKVFSMRILPLLEEYFFEDWQKIRLVLADNQKPHAASFIVEGDDPEDDLARLFGSDHGMDSYSTKRHYSLHKAALYNPDAYIGIYNTLST
ncbi:MAG: AAA family ATPase [Pseudomonas sp.]